MDRIKESERERRNRIEEEEEYELYRREQNRRRGIRESAPKKKKSEPPVRRSTGRRYRESGPPRKRKKRYLVLKGAAMLFLLAVLAFAGLVAFVHTRLRTVDPDQFQSALEKSVNDTALNNASMAGYRTIALFGVDSREQDLMDGDNRSDTIMIAAINNASGKVRIVSVYRDTYMDVGDGYYTRCNAAYAYGGPAQAVAMLNSNLDLNITDFVTIGFEGLADVIDALGGIELDITEEEAEYMNSYMEDMYYELGIPYEEVEHAGPQQVSGIQATAYCRIRYTEGDDFKRTERQRTVLSLTIEKAKRSGPLTLLEAADRVLDKTLTSLTSTELVSLLAGAGKYEIEDQGGFPESSQWVYGTINSQSVVVPNTLESNVCWLHSFLYDDDSYTPSEEVAQRSETIRNTPR